VHFVGLNRTILAWFTHF